jgi:sialate O-acetylesterase
MQLVRKILVFSLLLWLFPAIFGQVKLPRLISDGVILQRDTKVKIWGWASTNEPISVHFHGSTYKTAANDKGDWSIELPKMKAGGPFDMEIKASNTITLKNILIGDVWVCSGQSNMELSMERASPLYQKEIKQSENPNIRQFVVPKRYNFNKAEQDLVGGNWVTANPKTIMGFSAVAYFFAKNLYDKYKVPIGLINSALGGSPAEAWMSEDALKQFPEYYKEAQRFKDSTLIKQIETADNTRIQDWYKRSGAQDEGYLNQSENWRSPDLNTSDWSNIEVPAYWTGTPLANINGVVWYRKKLNIPATMAGKPARLLLGRIVDADSVFVNNQFVGTTSYQYPPRRYNIPAGLLKEGENTIVVRVISNAGTGGIVPDKTYEIIAGDEKINLTGTWLYKVGAPMEPLGSQTFVRWKPGGLYNAMIHPLHNFRIKGTIWYQGESNASRATEYENLFESMITDWRKNWNQGNFPFIFVQLPNFMEAKNEPGESQWALIREAQLKTLNLPNTGMAVAIDLGEWNDIHPLRKAEVGYRLSLEARRLAYGESKLVSRGPVFKSMKVNGNKIILTFENIGSGLITKDNAPLKGFSMAGTDKRFVWAEAIIQNNQVIVSSPQVKNPVAVRYAWADNPEGANLYNSEGLPASPFRTDDGGEK